jgi:hypothetical protein
MKQCFFLLFRLTEPVPYKSTHFNAKTLMLEEGTPLPITFSFAKGMFQFTVQQNLSVLFNGTK